ncbi:hypothetical protein ACDF64_02155 [Agromyces sp. MMS24-JH15]|uniref:hypothetical protein n=1 Tax=Agromyces sp. MMS24-JH15 TaxID=3243765 RepID=UPI003749F4C6
MAAQGYVQVFQQRWAVVAVSVAVCVGLAGIITVVLPKTYTSTATLFLQVESSNSSLAELSQFSIARVGSYPQLVYSADVLGYAADELEGDLTEKQIASRVTAENPTGTVLVEVTAEGRTAQDASDLANAVAEGLSREVSEIENTPDASYSVDLAVQIPAAAPASPSAPQPVVLLGLGLVTGLAVGAALALLLAQLDTRVRSAADVRRITGLPVFGRLRQPRRVQGRLETDPEDDGYLEAVLNIRHANGGAVPELLLLVPPTPDAAPAHVRVGLARAYAESGRQVLLVESVPDRDSELPEIADLFGRPGVGDLLMEGSVQLTGSVRPVEVTDDEGAVWAVPSGVETPTDLVVEERFPALAGALVDYADLAVLQTAPQSRPLGLHAVATSADVVVIVVAHAKTTESELARAVTVLRLEGVRPIGVVFADVRRLRHDDLAAGWRVEDFDAEPRRAVNVPKRPSAVASAAKAARPAPAAGRTERPAAASAARKGSGRS